MSLLDDYMESSEAAHGTSTVQYGADTYTPTNGFDGLDNVRVRIGHF
jgi:isocitrate dehydrogenase